MESDPAPESGSEQLLAQQQTAPADDSNASLVRWLLLGFTFGVGAVSAGTQAVLALFLSKSLRFSDNAASQLVSAYVCCYCLCGVLGALYADRHSARAAQIVSSLIGPQAP